MSDHTERYAALIEHQARRAQRLWAFALITPIVYLGIGWFIDTQGWVETGAGAAHPFDRPFVQSMLATIAFCLLVTTIWWRVRRRRVDELRADPLHAVDRWMRDFYVLATLADSQALLGLVYFAISGRHWALLVGGALAYLGYALSHPRRDELDAIDPPATTGG